MWFSSAHQLLVHQLQALFSLDETPLLPRISKLTYLDQSRFSWNGRIKSVSKITGTQPIISRSFNNMVLYTPATRQKRESYTKKSLHYNIAERTTRDPTIRMSGYRHEFRGVQSCKESRLGPLHRRKYMTSRAWSAAARWNGCSSTPEVSPTVINVNSLCRFDLQRREDILAKEAT